MPSELDLIALGVGFSCYMILFFIAEAAFSVYTVFSRV